MSSLQMSLLLLALLAIAMVLAFNAWIVRGRRPRSRTTQGLAGEGTAGAGRLEPSLKLDGMAAESGEPMRQPLGPVLDARTDCIVELALPAPLSGERLLALTRSVRRAGGKPVVVEVARTPTTPAAHEDDPPPLAPQWQAPVLDESFDRVRIGVLLTNRNGPLNAMEFSEFVATVQTLGDQLSVLADTPDMTEVLARARALDEVCASLDAQLGIAVEAREPLGVNELARLAGEAGCKERGNNRYARLGPQGEVLFSIALADVPNRLSLLLDVPRAPAAESPWDEMLACGRLCAERLGGRLIDEGGRPFADGELADIAEQIRTRQERLEMIGIDAGSPLALRLFN